MQLNQRYLGKILRKKKGKKLIIKTLAIIQSEPSRIHAITTNPKGVVGIIRVTQYISTLDRLSSVLQV